MSYFVLHYFATQEIALATGLEDAGSTISSNLFKFIATVGQYLFPGLFVIGGAVSFMQAGKRKSLLNQTASRTEQSALFDMSWREFEALAGEAFRREGYQVTENASAGPDGGVDLILKKGSETFLVQCKQWRSQQVGVKVVRELYGVMSAKGATGGIVVCAGNYSVDAREFAAGRNIQLIDGPGLKKLISFDHPGTQGKQSGSASSLSTHPPDCPVCNKPMLKRIAKKGQNAGKGFWGCSAFPRCSKTLPLE